MLILFTFLAIEEYNGQHRNGSPICNRDYMHIHCIFTSLINSAFSILTQILFHTLVSSYVYHSLRQILLVSRSSLLHKIVPELFFHFQGLGLPNICKFSDLMTEVNQSLPNSLLVSPQKSHSLQILSCKWLWSFWICPS